MDDYRHEDFRLIPGFSHQYMINREGEVRNYRTGHKLQTEGESGYWNVHLQGTDGKSYNRAVRKLIKKAFPNG